MTGPYRITDREAPRVITGYFMRTEAPNRSVLAPMPGMDDLFSLVFSTEAKLASSMKMIGIVVTIEAAGGAHES